MAFAAICLLVGVAANGLWGLDSPDRTDRVIAWIAGCWFHIECQSFLFFLLDYRPYQRVRLWAFWRKVSLYTTAFVVLDWAAGPPLFGDYWEGNFPWLLDRDTWKPGRWWPITERDLFEIIRGVVYYWWMAVLAVTLWRRLRRKWGLILILLLMPMVTMASCRFGYHLSNAVGGLGIGL